MILIKICLSRIALHTFALLFLVTFPSVGSAADLGVKLISTELPGLYELKDGKYIGALAALFAEASRRSGVVIEYRSVPWVRAMKETEQNNDQILFPISRNKKRENRFTWITLIKEIDMCIATNGASINTIDEAKKLKRVVVWRGTSAHSFVKDEGFNHIITVSKIQRIIQLLKTSTDIGWYYICEEAQSYLDPSTTKIKIKLGKPIAKETQWLAGGKHFKQTLDVKKFIAAIVGLKKEGFYEKLILESKK